MAQLKIKIKPQETLRKTLDNTSLSINKIILMTYTTVPFVILQQLQKCRENRFTILQSIDLNRLRLKTETSFSHG